jgi:hypothetical protein
MNALIRWTTALAALLALLAPAPAGAQQTGALSGVVRDNQGGVLPGVTVNVTGGAAGGATRSTVSTDQGLYCSPPPPGRHGGLRAHGLHDPDARRGGRAGQRTTRLDIELGVGGLQETIT